MTMDNRTIAVANEVTAEECDLGIPPVLIQAGHSKSGV